MIICKKRNSENGKRERERNREKQKEREKIVIQRKFLKLNILNKQYVKERKFAVILEVECKSMLYSVIL